MTARRNPSSFLPWMLGPLNLQINGEETDVERRETVNIVGSVTVEDDPDNEVTVVDFSSLGGGGGGGDASYPIDLTDGAEVDVPAAGLIGSNGTNLTSVTTSAGVAALLSDETGTGALVFANTPTLVTPNIGAATGTSLNLSGALTLGTDLSVPNGGTGASTFTADEVVIGAGASALTTATNVKAGSGFVSVGATVAASGSIRLSSTGSVYGVQGGVDYRLIELAGNIVSLGQDAGVTGILINGSTSHSFAIGGTTRARLTSAGLALGSSFRITLDVPAIAADRTLSFPLLTGNDTFVTADFTQTLTNKTLTAPVVTTGTFDTPALTTPKLADSAGGQFYVFAVSNLTADRTVTWPLLTGNDTLVFESHTQTLSNKTLTTVTITTPSISSPTISSAITLNTSGMLTTASGNTKGTSYDKCPVNVQTTDATVTTLDSFTLASNTAVCVTWMVTATKSDLSAAAGYSVSAVFKNNAGTVAQVGTTTTTVIGESNSSWDATSDNSTTTIRLRVTGVAATTIQWTSIMTRLDVIP